MNESAEDLGLLQQLLDRSYASAGPPDGRPIASPVDGISRCRPTLKMDA